VPNRTVAFDTIAVHAVGIVALFAVRNDAEALLDVAIVTAVLGFLGTTMLARYLERAHTRRVENSVDPAKHLSEID
jgi:multisubunit Na+/H+ antiporter MnhF subunit